MRQSFDDVEINPACPKCGQGRRKTVRWLREEGQFRLHHVRHSDQHRRCTHPKRAAKH